jgi:pyridoxal phosphate enzyme (YggS family)
VQSLIENLKKIRSELQPYNARLVAVSKLQAVEKIKELFEAGHPDFGENYVQELCEKREQLPATIHWHFIGHLQTNKVKLIIPFASLIHGVDSLKLLREINKQAGKSNHVQAVLIQIYIATEESKFGFSFEEADELFDSAELRNLKHIQVKGLMGMASFSDDMKLVRSEFKKLKKFYDKQKEKNAQMEILSMGMTADYKIALEEGSNMVRIGSAIFGERQKKSG